MRSVLRCVAVCDAVAGATIGSERATSADVDGEWFARRRSASWQRDAAVKRGNADGCGLLATASGGGKESVRVRMATARWLARATAAAVVVIVFAVTEAWRSDG